MISPLLCLPSSLSFPDSYCDLSQLGKRTSPYQLEGEKASPPPLEGERAVPSPYYIVKKGLSSEEVIVEGRGELYQCVSSQCVSS